MEEEEVEGFKNVWSEGHSYKRVNEFREPLEACKGIELQLVLDFMDETIRDIFNQSIDQYRLQDIHSQIFTVQFRKNQTEEFKDFINFIFEKFDKSKYLFNISPEKVGVVCLMKSTVREIVLNMYVYLIENPDLEMVVFIAGEMTDANEENIYCFEKGLKDKNVVLIMCTHHEFNNSLERSNLYFERFQFQFYNPKELFCEYVYKCLSHPDIKPYLPSEVLSLITDMTYYTISFRESCRRFMYCLQRSLMLYKKERTFVEFNELIMSINTAVVREIKIYQGFKKISYEKILKVILAEKSSFSIPEKDLVLEIAFRTGAPNEVLIEEGNIIFCMRERLKNELKKNEKYKKFAEYLEDKVDNPTEKAGKKKKTRSEQLGIDPSKNLTAKNKFENQVTKIIKDATALIRQQASHIKWEDLKFELRIKPQIPYLIKQSWLQGDESEVLVEEVLQNYSAPLTKYLRVFPEDELGKGIYLLKCLEYAGLIEISKKTIKPIVYTKYFDKATFSNKQK